MFDGVLRRMIDPVIERSAGAFVRAGISATALTLLGLAAALGRPAFIALGSSALTGAGLPVSVARRRRA